MPVQLLYSSFYPFWYFKWNNSRASRHGRLPENFVHNLFYLFNALLLHLCHPVCNLFLLPFQNYYLFFFQNYNAIFQNYNLNFILNLLPYQLFSISSKRYSMLYVLSSCWNTLFNLGQYLNWSLSCWSFSADLLSWLTFILADLFFLLTMQNYNCLRTQPYFLSIFYQKVPLSWCKSVFGSYLNRERQRDRDFWRWSHIIY